MGVVAGESDGDALAEILPRRFMDENRLEARLVPLGGGVQVRLIFSKGIEHSESEDDE